MGAGVVAIVVPEPTSILRGLAGCRCAKPSVISLISVAINPEESFATEITEDIEEIPAPVRRAALGAPYDGSRSINAGS